MLLIFSAFVDYINGRIIDKYYARAGATIALVSSLVINLGLLAMFKYSGFLLKTSTRFYIRQSLIRISNCLSEYRFTFQTLSYTIDMYRGKTRVQKSFLGFLAYVSMFPQLVAGPIVRYSTVASELNSRRVTADDFAYGVKRFTAGMCKKVMLANSSGAVASMVLDSTRLTVASSWLGIIMYTFQIYFDFSGYSDMAIGLGRMLGFHFSENFEYPYISRSITEFWRRWHISLSTFFRDYVYIPLGGNRYHAIRNIFIVWLFNRTLARSKLEFYILGIVLRCTFCLLKKHCLKRNFKKNSRSHLLYIHYVLHNTRLGAVLFYGLKRTLDIHKECVRRGYGIVRLDGGVNILYECMAYCGLRNSVNSDTDNYTQEFLQKSKVFAAISEPILVIVGLGVCFVLLVGQTYNPFCISDFKER